MKTPLETLMTKFVLNKCSNWMLLDASVNNKWIMLLCYIESPSIFSQQLLVKKYIKDKSQTNWKQHPEESQKVAFVKTS